MGFSFSGIDMKLFLSAASLMLAAHAPCALADTIYKCLGAGGKVAFSSLPCDGAAKETGQLAVPPPEPADASAARLKRERERLRTADQQFQRRRADRDADDDDARRRASYAQRSSASKKQQDERNKVHMQQQEAARLNAARIGNCTTRRLEAGCL
jgi:type IV secretory pathway VirB10-like protein